MGVVSYKGVEAYLNADAKHKALFEAYFVDTLNQANAEQLKEWYEWYTSDKEIPEHNIPDWDNDTIDLLRAKVLAISDVDKGGVLSRED